MLTQQQQEQAANNNFNFDHPDAFDFDLIISTLKKLKQGRSVQVPIYDFTTHSRKKDWVGGGSGPQGRGRRSSSWTSNSLGSFVENTVWCKRHHLRGHHGLC